VAAGQLPRTWSFVLVSLATLVLSIVVGIPAPLNPVYEDRYGISAGVLTGAFAVYVLCAAAAMLTCGQLSDRIGRRTVSAAALGFSMASCLAFLAVQGALTFMLARGLAGIGVGLGMSALGAFVVDLAPGGLRWIAALVTSAAAPVGVAIGAIGSGALVQFAPWPTHLGFIVSAVLVGLCIIAIWLSPETVTPPEEKGRLVPRIAVPSRLRVAFVGGCLCFVACWALGGFYQSLGATIADELLGVDGALLRGTVAASVIGSSLFGGLLTSRLTVGRALALGVGCFVLGVALIAITVQAGAPAPFLAASVLAGIGFGGSFNSCMRALLDATQPSEIAGLLAAVYLIGFAGTAIPYTITGIAVEAFGMEVVVLAVCVAVALMVVAASLVVAAFLRTDVGSTGRLTT
jgi:MFS family permease